MYRDQFTQYDSRWESREVIANKNVIDVGIDAPQFHREDIFLQKVLLKGRDHSHPTVGISTGRYQTFRGKQYLQITGSYGRYGYGFVRMEDIDQSKGRVVQRATQEKAQQLINALIYNNKVIAQQNLFCVRLINLLESQGTRIDNERRGRLAVLQQYLQERNSRLLNSKLLNAQRTSSPSHLSKYYHEMDKFLKDPFAGRVSGIGIAPIYVAAIVVGAVVGAVVGWLIWNVFKKDYDRSELDLQYSIELKDSLIKQLDKETYQKLMQENKSFQDLANSKIKKKGFLDNIKSIGYYAGAGLLALVVISNFNK